jgi:hypothetical protein
VRESWVQVFRESLAEAREDIATGRVFTEEQIRKEFGVPDRER